MALLLTFRRSVALLSAQRNCAHHIIANQYSNTLTVNNEKRFFSVPSSSSSSSSSNDKEDPISEQNNNVSLLTKTNVTATPSLRALKFIRRAAGNLFSSGGFILSSAAALLTDRGQYKRQWKPTFKALRKYLNQTGIGQELQGQLQSFRLLDHLLILVRVQNLLYKNNHRRVDFVSVQRKTKQEFIEANRMLPTPAEAHRYMRHATAVYGESMIRAVEAEVHGYLDNRISPLVQSKIAHHVKLPENDIVLLDVDYYGASSNHLRHYVAVDRDNKQVVLSIRGTFSLSEIFVDVAGFSRPFCNGEAHSEMASMAERVWEVAGPTVVKLLKDDPEYELVLTGHSLGAGTASLLHMLLHHEPDRLPQGRTCRCFAFAPPPVYTGGDESTSAKKTCVSFIHQDDVVPFLSVDAIRHTTAALASVGSFARTVGWRERLRLITGRKEPPKTLLDQVEAAYDQRLAVKPGAPRLTLPSEVNVWMYSESNGGDTFETFLVDADKLARLGIGWDTSMVLDHFPPRYEHALHQLETEQDWNIKV